MDKQIIKNTIDKIEGIVETVIDIGIMQSVKKIGRLDIDAISKHLHQSKDRVLIIKEFKQIIENRLPLIIANRFITNKGLLTQEGNDLTERYQKLLDT